MRRRPPHLIELSEQDQQLFEDLVQDGRIEQRVARRARILWLYERVEWLFEHDEIVLALDEKPTIQVLERCVPTRLLRPGEIERREFEYIRHGIVNLLVALVVHSGKMRAWCLPANDSYH